MKKKNQTHNSKSISFRANKLGNISIATQFWPVPQNSTFANVIRTVRVLWGQGPMNGRIVWQISVCVVTSLLWIPKVVARLGENFEKCIPC
jgi:hypothetical protein